MTLRPIRNFLFALFLSKSERMYTAIPIFAVFILSVSYSSCQSTVSSSSSTTSFTSTYANSSPTSSYSSSGSSASSPSSSAYTGSTQSSYSTTSDSASFENSSEKLVSYTTGQKTIFIACCGGTFVLLVALAILSGLSDTIARSKQKTKRTHA